MGLYGKYENFDHDVAYDTLGILLDHIITQIRTAFGYDKTSFFDNKGNGQILANIDIILTLCNHYNTYVDLLSEEVLTWKKLFLESFDHDMSIRRITDSDYAANRRLIIMNTFDTLLRVVREGEE